MLSSISTWILSIAGIICLSVLVELILPDGQMNRYIKGIFAFVIVFVVISPIPRLMGQNIDFSSLLDFEQTFEVDENYLYQLNLDKLSSLQTDIEEECENYGYANVKAYINADILNSQMQIESVYVDLSELVISANAEHTDIGKIKKHIVQIIQNKIEISEEMIFYEY